ncbi:hypothetical protein PENTCL1PPCAC_23049, partial [Pristionchus entomophagus]
PPLHRSSFSRRSRRRRLPLHIGTMIADPGSILSFILAIVFSVGLLLLLCTKHERAEKPSGKRPIAPLVDDGGLDDVEPVRRQVSRADEILAGKKGNKNEYMTMKQLEPSESFNKSIGVPSSFHSVVKKK